jgi:hypothetical protein
MKHLLAMKTSSLFRASIRPFLSPLLVALIASACQDAETHELGFTQSSRPLTGEEPGEPTERFFGSLDDFVGRWQGTAEAALPLALDSDGHAPLYHFPSGSTAFALDLTRGVDMYDSPAILGTLTFGAGTPPPPPTDPDLGYPVGVDYMSLLSYGSQTIGLPNNLDPRFPPFEAFPYSVSGYSNVPDLEDEENYQTSLGDGVLALRFNTYEIIDGWCQLQTPHLSQHGVYDIWPLELGSLEFRGDGTNAECALYGEYPNLCGPDVDPFADDTLSCLGEPPVIAHASCDKTFLSGYCECRAEGCRAIEVEFGGPTTSSLLVRRVGDGLVGVFQNEIFLNARNLSVPMGQATFTRLPD